MFYNIFLLDLKFSLAAFPGLDHLGVFVLYSLMLQSPVEISIFYTDAIPLFLIDGNQSLINFVTEKKLLYSFHGYDELDKLTNKHWQWSDWLVDNVEDRDNCDSKRQVNSVSWANVGGEAHAL